MIFPILHRLHYHGLGYAQNLRQTQIQYFMSISHQSPYCWLNHHLLLLKSSMFTSTCFRPFGNMACVPAKLFQSLEISGRVLDIDTSSWQHFTICSPYFHMFHPTNAMDDFSSQTPSSFINLCHPLGGYDPLGSSRIWYGYGKFFEVK